MIRYRPVHKLLLGAKTLGEMEAIDQGDWVQYFDYAELLSDFTTALAWIQDGEDDSDHKEAMDLIVSPFKAKYDL